MRSLSREDWGRPLDQLESPSVGQVAEALTDVRNVDVSEAYDVVGADLACADSALVEDTDGAACGEWSTFVTKRRVPEPMRATRTLGT